MNVYEHHSWIILYVFYTENLAEDMESEYIGHW